MSSTDVENNDVGIEIPEQVPIPPGAAAATMPTMTPANAPPPGGAPMDSMITDFLIRKFGGAGVQGANAAPPMPPPTAMQGAPPPPPRTGSANAAPMAPPQPPQPPAAAPQAPLTMQDLTRRGALQQYLPDVINAFLPTPEARPRGATGSANANPGASLERPPVPMPTARPASAPPMPPPAPRTGSANAAPLAASPGSAPSSASWSDIIKSVYTPASMQPAEDVNKPAYGGKSVLSGILTGTSPNATPAEAASKPDSVLDKVMTYIKNRGSSGSANAAGGGKETTGDELAARRQQAKVGPPQLESLPKGASSRYTRPYAKGGVKEGQKRPMPKQKQQAPRASAARSQPSQPQSSSSKQRAGAAPQTARGGRSAYAQSLIDSMGPRGAGVTTYIEPSTGNEILTGNGIYQNLGKTSTGTQKPSYTKFFDR